MLKEPDQVLELQQARKLSAVAAPTVGEHAWRSELNVRQGPQVIQNSTSVPIFLRVVNKSADVLLLAVVSNPRADHHRDILCAQKEREVK